MASTPTAQAPAFKGLRADLPIYLLSFVVFLLIAFAGVLLGQPWRSWLPGAEGVKSLFGGVNAAVYTFMSNIQ